MRTTDRHGTGFRAQVLRAQVLYFSVFSKKGKGKEKEKEKGKEKEKEKVCGVDHGGPRNHGGPAWPTILVSLGGPGPGTPMGKFNESSCQVPGRNREV